ncbi:YitT family protein [Vagococcus humatus]|uniref:YitT family protein n=1 Tax=Vagococcus humatus TaxID=1889241 RepID=A0A3R9ZVU1_9ENTE|nr:YitT family protein [Vagococcus humatus]RST88948.1 YitT family protein [Vagococcus humatus]
MKDSKTFNMLYRFVIASLYGILSAVGLNFFLLPAKTYSSGITGIAQLITSFMKNMGFATDVATFVLLLNIPLIIVAWFKLGKSYTFFSILAVATNVIALKVVPIQQIVGERFTAAAFGGAMLGTGVGLCFRNGFSTGGTDIIVMLIRQKTGQKVGFINNIINGSILVVAGIAFGWSSALYSVIAIFTASFMIDYFYIQQQRITVTIFSKHPERFMEALKHFLHGATVWNGTGLHTGEDTSVITTVISKYDLNELERIIHLTDPEAFVNIQPTSSLLGRFQSSDDF